MKIKANRKIRTSFHFENAWGLFFFERKWILAFESPKSDLKRDITKTKTQKLLKFLHEIWIYRRGKLCGAWRITGGDWGHATSDPCARDLHRRGGVLAICHLSSLFFPFALFSRSSASKLEIWICFWITNPNSLADMEVNKNFIKNLEFDSIHKDKTMDDKHTESFVKSNSELKNL